MNNNGISYKNVPVFTYFDICFWTDMKESTTTKMPI